MRLPPRSTSRLRVETAALIASGSVAVHQLRWLGAPEGASGQGHEYVAALAVLLGFAVAAALGTFAVRLLVPAPGAGCRPACALRRWAWLTAAVLLAFAVQELAAALLSPGHPGLLAALLTGGGWIALPVAALAGAAAALLLRAGDAALEWAARRRATPRPAAPPGFLIASTDAALPRLGLLDRLRGRAPPPGPGRNRFAH